MPVVQVHFATNGKSSEAKSDLVAALKDGVALAMKDHDVAGPDDVFVVCSTSPLNDIGRFDALVLIEPNYQDARADDESEITAALLAALKADQRVTLRCDIRYALVFCTWVTLGEV